MFAANASSWADRPTFASSIAAATVVSSWTLPVAIKPSRGPTRAPERSMLMSTRGVSASTAPQEVVGVDRSRVRPELTLARRSSSAEMSPDSEWMFTSPRTWSTSTVPDWERTLTGPATFEMSTSPDWTSRSTLATSRRETVPEAVWPVILVPSGTRTVKSTLQFQPQLPSGTTSTLAVHLDLLRLALEDPELAVSLLDLDVVHAARGDLDVAAAGVEGRCLGDLLVEGLVLLLRTPARPAADADRQRGHPRDRDYCQRCRPVHVGPPCDAFSCELLHADSRPQRGRQGIGKHPGESLASPVDGSGCGR